MRFFFLVSFFSFYFLRSFLDDSRSHTLHSLSLSLPLSNIEHYKKKKKKKNESLAAQRNRIINLNLRLTVLTFSTAVACATPAAFFGMNLQSGLEDVPGMFWPVAGWSVAGAAALGLGVHALLRWWPDASHRRRLADLKALRDLLIHHLDDLDAISAAVVQTRGSGSGSGGNGDVKLGKKEFAAAVARAGVWMLPEEIDLLFRVYDADSSGFLEVSEVIAAHNRAAR